jgi:hypothetical protein
LKKENAIEAQFVESIVQQFQDRGFAVKNCTLRCEAGCTNALWDVDMTKVLTNAYASRMAKSIRPEGMELATHVQADGLIFVNIFAYRSTEGRKALAAFGNLLSLAGAAGGTPGPWTPFSQMIVHIVFVDGATGDVIWQTAHDFRDIDRASGNEIAMELMKKFPKP